MNTKIVGISIATFIGIVVLASVLMPVLDDATATTDTFTNNGYFRMTHYDDTTDHVVTWTYEKPSIITVDGVDVPISYNVKNGQVSVLVDTNFIVRLVNDANGNPVALAMLTPTGGTASANVSSSQTATINLTSGAMTATIGTTSKSETYTDIYVPSLDGPFSMKIAENDAYINGDSLLVGYGMSRIQTASGTMGNPGVGLSFVGTYDDGITGSVWRGSDSTTLSNVVANVTEDKDHDDLYSLESITATATYTETVDSETVSTDSTVTYNYLLVPYEVSAERVVHFTDGQNAIFAVIPVIIILAVLLGVVAAVIRSRLD